MVSGTVANIRKGFWLSWKSSIFQRLMNNMDLFSAISFWNSLPDFWQKDFAGLTDEKYLSLSLKGGIAVTSQNNSLSQALEQTKAALTAARRGKNQFVSFAELNEEEKRDSSEAAFNEVASLERLKEMTLSSVALNLFDREGKTSVVLDILSLKLQEKYRLSNMIITHFSREYMVDDLFYCWQRNHFQGWDGLVHCKEKEYQQFMEEQEM